MSVSTNEKRILILNAGESLETKLLQFNLGWCVRFMLGPSLFGKNVEIRINVPKNCDEKFDRRCYNVLPWNYEDENKRDDTAAYAEIKFTSAGSFHYVFTVDKNEKLAGSGYLLVRPSLSIGKDQKPLSLNSILCQTVLTKLLGPFKDWEKRLSVTAQSGYNMIHFTPIQKLGQSQSCYSLNDQHALNPAMSDATRTCSFEDVMQLVQKMNDDWQVLSVTDVVLNHTSNDSQWVQEHPDATYNLCNSPHLRPAYLLDKAFHHFALEIADGKWSGQGLPALITEEAHLNKIRDIMKSYFLPKIKLHEFFTINVDDCIEKFKSLVIDTSANKKKDVHPTLKIIQDEKFRRNACSVDMSLALALYSSSSSECDDSVTKACENLRHRLNELNQVAMQELNHHLDAAIENVIRAVRYERLQHDGPRVKEVSKKNPLVPPYFTYPVITNNLDEEEDVMASEKCSLVMAHNGWVMNDDPLRNFIDKESNVYLRRELIAWGDSVKLRYGNQPSDSPYLWQHMKTYVEQTARIFYGIRLDNCHSTPIHVAEYMLDAARQVRPNLYVFAELFTSNEDTDNIFVNRLGISSLIRESMSAHDSHELGRQVHRYGGKPVGSFTKPCIRPAVPSVAHALFLDQTHDNPSPVQKRSAYDLLPSTALVSMACCASGSNRGYDELVPFHINVVTEARLYSSWSDDSKLDDSMVNLESGIIKAKRALNELHFHLGESGFSEVYVDQVDYNVVAVTRHHPGTRESIILIAHTAFSEPSCFTPHVPNLCVPGKIQEIVLEAHMEKVSSSPEEDSNKFLRGLTNFKLVLRSNIELCDSNLVTAKVPADATPTEVQFTRFPPGSVIAFRVALHENSVAAIKSIKEHIAQVQSNDPSDFNSIVSNLNLADLNTVLFRCDNEERDDGHGFGAYDIPNYGTLPYCGLQGVMGILRNIRQHNDLGHPLCENIRSGDWLCDYIYKRLLVHPSTKPLGEWFEKVFGDFKNLPRYLIPCYFDAVITSAYSSLINRIWSQMSSFVQNGSAFVKMLALASVQLAGVVKSSPFPHLSPNLVEPQPASFWNASKHKNKQACVTLSAGLPHFSSGYMRNWGRDTFISLKGLFLLTGRFQEARFIILAFAGCLRHGLIPNLLDKGTHSRFNCRDAVWWWLQCIQDYCQLAPAGHSILQDKVHRLFPDDDSEPQQPGQHDQPLHDVIQESLRRHVQGVSYRERHAGSSLDVEMSSDGFNNSIGVSMETGFVFGGNGSNCGTWMDKMGRSVEAGTKGKPATPRDGSAVELVGLCKSALRWLISMHKQNHYPYDSVQVDRNGELITLKFEEWNKKIQDSFEAHFWIPAKCEESNKENRDLIHRRSIYKDSYKASQFWADFQLRPNFLIAMVVAPELFTPANAWLALSVVEECLLGPLGMKTLDPADWAYDGNYVNSDTSSNKKTAGGYNYHQGPEWLWPVGFFCCAKLMFAPLVGGQELKTKTENSIRSILSKHYEIIQRSEWHGLPELTNKDGQHCPDSCMIQAWSHACLLEVLYDLQKS